NYIEALLELSRVYYTIGNNDYAFQYINKALKIAPLNDDLLIFSANIDTNLKKYDNAEEKYKRVLKKNPLNLDAQNGLANLYLITKRFILAKKSLEDILKTDKTNFNALSLLAAFYEITDKSKAENYYIMNIENNSLNPESYFLYSVFNFNNGNITKAVDNVLTAIKIKDTPKYKKYYANYQLFLNKGDNALKVFRELLKDGENNFLNYYHLGFSYYLISDFENAKSSFNKTLGLREDDEISSYFLNQLLINKYDVDDSDRKNRSEYFYNLAIKSKKESAFDLYVFFLKESLRLYPKNTKSRLEVAEYYKSQNFKERYIRELRVAKKYSDDIDLKDRLDIEEKSISYKLGDDWGVDQYNIENDIFYIPLFVNQEINNIHYNFEKIYGRVMCLLSYEKQKYEINIYDEKNYTVMEKMNISKDKKSPFYLELTAKEMINSVDISLKLKNSYNNEIIREYDTYQLGNNKIILSANTLLRKVDNDIPFKARIIKIANNKAIINAGRRSGIKLKDAFYILSNKEYLIEMKRSNFIYTQNDIKGTGIAVKIDENISEINYKDNGFFKDIDVDDIVVIYK
ncbi:MAG TPA: tetratricopeptide repeat protein, partial [Spirochaetota bacterium]|nr:tetratricopeptide repeat protein [Spirochaetota bacterium]